MQWQQAAQDWIAASLVELTIQDVTVVRERIWSSVWRVETSGGVFWFKRNHPDMRHERGLVSLLAQLAPQEVSAPVAVNADHRWLLTPDLGPTLSELPAAEKPAAYVKLAQALARVQLAAAGSRPLLELGIPRFDPARFAETMADHLAYCRRLPRSHPLRFVAADEHRIMAAAHSLQRAWDDLGPGGPGLSVDHNDLHLGNACVGPNILDWGDAVLAHPYGNLRTLVIIARRLYGHEQAQLVRIKYLEVWGRTSPADYQRLNLAMELAAAQRFFAWRRMDDEASLAEYAHYARPLLSQLSVRLDQQYTP